MSLKQERYLKCGNLISILIFYIFFRNNNFNINWYVPPKKNIISILTNVAKAGGLNVEMIKSLLNTTGYFWESRLCLDHNFYFGRKFEFHSISKFQNWKKECRVRCFIEVAKKLSGVLNNFVNTYVERSNYNFHTCMY